MNSLKFHKKKSEKRFKNYQDIQVEYVKDPKAVENVIDNELYNTENKFMDTASSLKLKEDNDFIF